MNKTKTKICWLFYDNIYIFFLFMLLFLQYTCIYIYIVQSEIIYKSDNDNYNDERNPNKSHSGRLTLEWFILIKRKKVEKKNLENEWNLTILAIYTYIVLASKNIKVFRNKEDKKKLWQVYFNRYLFIIYIHKKIHISLCECECVFMEKQKIIKFCSYIFKRNSKLKKKGFFVKKQIRFVLIYLILFCFVRLYLLF